MPEPQRWRQKRGATEEVVAAVATLDSEPTPAPEAVGQQEDPSAVLAQLLSEIQKAVGDKANHDKVAAGLEEALSNISIADYPALADNPVVEKFVETVTQAKARSKDIPPGATIGRGLSVGKKPWTWQDVEKLVREGKMELVKVTCPENITVIWQGLRYTFVADTEVVVPSPFWTVYQDARANRKFAERHAAWLAKKTEDHHPDMVTPEGVRARGMGDKGFWQPGAGMIAGVGFETPGAAGATEGAGGESA